jgi:hypothetical protein
MGHASEQAGHPVYEDQEFVEIITPGHTRSTPIEPVNAEHRARWPEAYRAFKEGLEPVETGLPLAQWPVITSPSQVLMLKGLHIHTVEQLAGVSDAALQNMGPGGRELRQKAQDYLENAKTNAPLERERARADAAEERERLLQQQLTELSQRMSSLEAGAKSHVAA